MAYLTLKNINKIYPNGYHAVHNFSMEMEKGEFIVFVGPSGCGKSTTLRMIAGLEDISNGEFLIDGKRANEMGPRRSWALRTIWTVFPERFPADSVSVSPSAAPLSGRWAYS